ncbi:MAG: glutamate--tRNA ligase [Candidatus Eisenbacteria bacterium]|uniref:Glutamate--tRNA ligase n=1 Tax=Eiseniibacteriota bacterium TaxID=2212470 RepID=A0A849SGW9_UNCEI|nr:glutamate--tRNA ligase [Candidatus Eisenbacteria bacterium]
MRVRFAPSPTGWLHVGGARTALFNWLFARRHGGVLVLRIEDTDLERSSAASEQAVLEDLAWLELDWDEGPDRGGPHGPYRQSERIALYKERAELLVAQGAAYPCFCTDHELELRRQAALAGGRPPHYDGHCRTLSQTERDGLRAEGRPESVRFRVHDHDVVLTDRVRGEVRFPAGMVGDFVVLRANGLPTYNFACVVDDAGMQITHVIRADEHLANTPRQLMLYAAFGWDPPAFAHVPLILNPDRTKMSKREGEAAVAVGDWRRAGYVPEALTSYLALLGFHPGDDREVLTRAELVEAFELERVGRSGSVFDAAKLRWMNAHYLHHADGATLERWSRAFLPASANQLEPPALERMLEVVRGNLHTLTDLPVALAPFLDDAPPIAEDAAEALRSERAAPVLAAVANEVRLLAEWNAEGFRSAVTAAGKAVGAKGRELFQPVRAALTGQTHGPELPQLAELLGRDRVMSRLEAHSKGRDA